VCAFCIELNFNIFSFQALADVEGLAEQMDIPMSCDLSEEGDPSRSNAQGFGWNNILGRQFAELGSSAMLNRSQVADARLNMLSVDRLLQAQQCNHRLEREGSGPCEAAGHGEENIEKVRLSARQAGKGAKDRPGAA